jgi:hypothetical protein
MATAAVDLDATLRTLASYRSGRALIPVADLPGLLELPEAEALDLVASLEADGWLETWDEPCLPGVFVILSSRGAERLGLELFPPERDDLELCRWIKRGSKPPWEGRPPHSFVLECDLAPRSGSETLNRGLDGRPDPKAVEDPGTELERQTIFFPSTGREWYVGHHHVRLIGGSVSWPIAPDESHHCGACHGRALPVGTACLWCLSLASGIEKPTSPPPLPAGQFPRLSCKEASARPKRVKPPKLDAPALDRPVKVKAKKWGKGCARGRRGAPAPRPARVAPAPATKRPQHIDLVALRVKLDAVQAAPAPTVA